MSDAPAISVQRLTKEYRIEQQKGGSALSEALTSPFRGRTARTGETFSAIDDVSFDVPAGTALGVVGRNGAGKSTLLKVLSRITKPTSGEVVLRGRVGSLLEVGTGFHPELTGRENVFMNGAMLGMRRAEIATKFDDIIEFAEVERFVDTPVKRYSSGMYVRLAFAVAAHLEPEILLVDEVLAVGDAEFQKKCLGKMNDVTGEGRTVLFVSHNTAAVQQLTQRCVLMERGRLLLHGPTPAVLERYLDVAGQAMDDADLDSCSRGDDSLGVVARLLRARLVGDVSGSYHSDERPSIEVSFAVYEALPAIRLAYTLYRFDGSPIGTAWAAPTAPPKIGDLRTLVSTLEGPALAPGSYYLALALGQGDDRSGATAYDIVMDTVHFTVDPPTTDAGTVAPWFSGWGAVRLPEPTVTLVNDVARRLAD